MTTALKLNDPFPDFELPDHRFRRTRLSSLACHSPIDERLGFGDGYPVIIVFYRGFFCPRDQRQMRLLVEFQDELAVNYAKLVAVAVQPPIVQASFAAGLGAKWVFCADTDRALINQINILDETEGEYANTAQPYTFVLRPDLTIHSIYNGWYFVGRPTLDELRRDLRAIMSDLSYYPYEVWNTPEVKAIRIPQSEWLDGAPPLGANGLAVASGIVSRFDLASGNGTIRTDETGEDIFFNFTAIPGEGYRTLSVATSVRFEIVENKTGRTARNIQTI